VRIQNSPRIEDRFQASLQIQAGLADLLGQPSPFGDADAVLAAVRAPTAMAVRTSSSAAVARAAGGRPPSD